MIKKLVLIIATCSIIVTITAPSMVHACDIEQAPAARTTTNSHGLGT